MDLRLRRRLAVAALALLAGACATLPPEIPEAADCRANYLAFEQRVDAADARNAGAHAIPGFPYLRSDRFLASFRDEVGDGPKFDAWVERLRRRDLEARAAELRNLGWDEPEQELRHLDRCGADWAARDLRDPARRALLRERAAVPDDYSLWRRVLGLYPLAVVFLDMGISDFNKGVEKDYATPLAELRHKGELVLWQRTGEPVGAPLRRDWTSDALGIPLLSAEHWRDLATTHAPHWLIETAGDFDAPGTPARREGKLSFDLGRPVTYFVPTFTRIGGQVHAQLVYVVWFSERPKSDALDPYGGALDGIVWRVTLDSDGEPLLYDTVHACGCYHYYFLAPRGAERLRRKRFGGPWQEPVLFPQAAPPAPFAVRVESGTHYVRRLVPLEAVSASRVALYAQADYDELLALPDGAGGTRSLFEQDGLVCGTERLERFFLWPAGIKSPGGMRQWGRHPTSFIGRGHFDDPAMMDRLFLYTTPDPP
jgi:hypothetical protein